MTSNGRPMGELRPLRRDRFIEAVAVVEMFRHVPAIEWSRLRSDLDEHVEQDIAPRA